MIFWYSLLKSFLRGEVTETTQRIFVKKISESVTMLLIRLRHPDITHVFHKRLLTFCKNPFTSVDKQILSEKYNWIILGSENLATIFVALIRLYDDIEVWHLFLFYDIFTKPLSDSLKLLLVVMKEISCSGVKIYMYARILRCTWNYYKVIPLNEYPDRKFYT